MQVWTFHGLSRVLTSMRLFQEDADIEVEGCMLLASVGELLYNNGYATEVFKLLEIGIRKHVGRVPGSEQISQGTLIVLINQDKSGLYCVCIYHRRYSSSWIS